MNALWNGRLVELGAWTNGGQYIYWVEGNEPFTEKVQWDELTHLSVDDVAAMKAEIETEGVLVGERAEEIPCETCGALCRACDQMAGEEREQWEADTRLNLALIGITPHRTIDEIYARAYQDDF